MIEREARGRYGDFTKHDSEERFAWPHDSEKAEFYSESREKWLERVEAKNERLAGVGVPKPDSPTVEPEGFESDEEYDAGLRGAIKSYLTRNPHRADEPEGWIANSLWCLELFPVQPGTPGREAVKRALEELAAVEAVA
jgi:hypothetical protein